MRQDILHCHGEQADLGLIAGISITRYLNILEGLKDFVKRAQFSFSILIYIIIMLFKFAKARIVSENLLLKLRVD